MESRFFSSASTRSAIRDADFAVGALRALRQHGSRNLTFPVPADEVNLAHRRAQSRKSAAAVASVSFARRPGLCRIATRTRYRNRCERSARARSTARKCLNAASL